LTSRSNLDIDPQADRVCFWIHVTPRARKAQVGPLHGDALRVAVGAPPVEGKANAACVHALSEALDVPRHDVGLDPAAKGRRKRVTVLGDPQALSARLHALAGVRD